MNYLKDTQIIFAGLPCVVIDYNQCDKLYTLDFGRGFIAVLTKKMVHEESKVVEVEPF